MKTCRLIGNIAVAFVLAVILFGLVAIIVDERASKAVSSADPKDYVQEVPFR